MTTTPPALEMTVDSNAWAFLNAAERAELATWVRLIGHDPSTVVGCRIIGEGVVEVEHFVDMAAGLFDHTRSVVHSPVLPPYIARWEPTFGRPAVRGEEPSDAKH